MDPLIFMAICSAVLVVVTISLLINKSRGVVAQGTSIKIPGLVSPDEDQGNLADVSKAGSLHEFLLQLHKQYGPIVVFWFGKQRVVSVASPSTFKQLVHVFDRPPELFKMLEPLITPDSILYANYENGRTRRQMYDKAFSYSALSNYYESFQLVSEEVASKWSAVGQDEHVPLQQHMLDLAIKAIAITAFGEYFKSDMNVSRLRKTYEMCFATMEETMTQGIPKEGTKRYQTFELGRAQMSSVVQEIIQHRKANSAGDDNTLFIDYVMALNDSEVTIFADCITYIIGGFHTTGNLLTWALYFLACNQDVQEKLAREIQTVLGDSKVNQDNIKELKYLRQVQEESLRCSVLAPWGAKFQDKDLELEGYVIPAKTPIITALGVMLQDEKYWPDPTRFDPERFNEENVKQRPSHVFSPFGLAGKRICPGYRFVYCETTVVLAVLVGRFRFRLAQPQNIKRAFGFVTRVSEEVWLSVSQR